MFVKNGIKGAYHQVSPRHLQGYSNEYVWRYNHRDDDAGMFLQLLLRQRAPSLRDLPEPPLARTDLGPSFGREPTGPEGWSFR